MRGGGPGLAARTLLAAPHAAWCKVRLKTLTYPPPAPGATLDVVDKQPMLEWIANSYKKFGCALEFVTDRSQEGSQFCRGFGGIGGVLRYSVDLAEFEEPGGCWGCMCVCVCVGGGLSGRAGGGSAGWQPAGSPQTLTGGLPALLTMEFHHPGTRC